MKDFDRWFCEQGRSDESSNVPTSDTEMVDMSSDDSLKRALERLNAQIKQLHDEEDFRDYYIAGYGDPYISGDLPWYVPGGEGES